MPRSDMAGPDSSTVSQLEEQILAARLAAVRATVAHPGEKGRALETEAGQLLRGLLPAEYGLSTGFVVHDTTGKPELSPQLDIIIYDSASSGPLARLGAVDVFPLEAVYGYVEVKACLRSTDLDSPGGDTIEGCLQQNLAIRKMTRRRFWRPMKTSRIRSKLVDGHSIAIRGFVFAFSSEGSIAGDADRLAQRMASASRAVGRKTHLHGLFVAGLGFFRTRPVEPGIKAVAPLHHVEYVREHALARFRQALLLSLARFPRTPERWTPDLERYYPAATWQKAAPGQSRAFSRRRLTTGIWTPPVK